jgi:hypothetical protein
MIKGDWGCAGVLAVIALFWTWAAITSLGSRNQQVLGLVAILFWAWALWRLFRDDDPFG